MTDTHVVSALKIKRAQVAGQIEALQGQLRQATIDLDHVEASLRLFDPDVDLAALSPRKVAPVLYDTKGDTGRVILEALRTAICARLCPRPARQPHDSGLGWCGHRGQVPYRRSPQLSPPDAGLNYSPPRAAAGFQPGE